MSDSTLPNSLYDVVPYSTKVHRGRHPDRLRTMAFLYGMTPPSIEGSSILEIGCGTGEHLIPLASEFPSAHFVGIDSAVREVTAARELAGELGLSNITFLHQTVEALPKDATKFSFILCHGMYSWVSGDTQASILTTIKEGLSEDGIALVSYNTHPGWHLRESVRSALRYYDEPNDEPEKRIKRAREVLKLLASSLQYDYERPYSIILHKEYERIAREPDAYLLHEFLNPYNAPILVSEFVGRLKANSLQYLCDSRFSRQSFNRLLTADIHPVAFKNMVKLASDEAGLEQAMDFLFLNTFRESIVCHADRGFDTSINADRLNQLSYATTLQFAANDDAPKGTTDYYLVDPRGVSVTIGDPREKAIIDVLLNSQPRYISFGELIDSARERTTLEVGEDFVVAKLLELIQRELVDVTLNPPMVADRILAHPKTTDFIRRKSKVSGFIPNLFFNTVEIGPLERAVLGALDGKTDLDELSAMALEMLSRGEATIKEDGEPITDSQRQKELVSPLVQETLETLRRAGMLL